MTFNVDELRREQKETLRKEFDEKHPGNWDEDRNAKFDFMVSKLEADRQSFIDSLRGKIEARKKALNENKDLTESATERRGYYAAIGECDEILTLLNETSGETGK